MKILLLIGMFVRSLPAFDIFGFKRCVTIVMHSKAAYLGKNLYGANDFHHMSMKWRLHFPSLENKRKTACALHLSTKEQPRIKEEYRV